MEYDINAKKDIQIATGENRNDIDDELYKQIHFAIINENQKNLKKLLSDKEKLNFTDLNSPEMDGDDVSFLAEALHDNTSIKSLRFWEISVGDIGAKSLAQLLKINHNIVGLELFICDIATTGSRYLGEALPESNISDFTLLCTPTINDSGALFLAAGLAKLSSLTSLAWIDNGDTNARYQALAVIIRENKSIKSLDLSESDFRQASLMQPMIDAISENVALERVYLRRIKITPERCKSLGATLAKSPSLKSIEISTYQEDISDRLNTEEFVQRTFEGTLNEVPLEEYPLTAATVWDILSEIIGSSTLERISIRAQVSINDIKQAFNKDGNNDFENIIIRKIQHHNISINIDGEYLSKREEPNLTNTASLNRSLPDQLLPGPVMGNNNNNNNSSNYTL